MWLFVSLFFVIAFAYSTLNLSLNSTKGWLIGVFLLIALCFSMYPLCIKQTNQTFTTILKDPNLVSVIALLQIFESILFIAFSVLQIKKYYGSNKRLWWNVLFSGPSFVLITGLFFIQTFVFVNTSGVSFFLTAIGFSLGVGLLLITCVLLIRKIISDWALRAELKLLMALFQIILAMFLPVILQGAKVPFTNLTVELGAIVICLSVILLFSLLGFAQYSLRKNKQKL